MSTNKTKIIICANDANAESMVSNRFARCNFYTLYNHEDLSFSFTENQAINEMSGAGGKAAKQIASLGAEVVLVPEIGPKAFDALEAFGIEIYRYGNKDYTVRDALYEYYENKLPKLLASTTRGKHA